MLKNVREQLRNYLTVDCKLKAKVVQRIFSNLYTGIYVVVWSIISAGVSRRCPWPTPNFARAVQSPILRGRCRIARAHNVSEYLSFAHARHTEWSLLLHDVIADWLIPFATNAAAIGAPKIANAFERPGQPPKFAPSWPSPWGSAPHPIHASLDPSESSSKTASQSIQPFSDSSPSIVPLLYNRPIRFPKKFALPFGDRVPN